MIKNIGVSILTMFGVGYFKYAPGTAASFITCLIFYILEESKFILHDNKIYILIFVIFILFYSIVFIDKLSKHFKNLKYFVIDCLRYNKHPSHYNLDEVLELIKIFKPKKTILTNLHSDLDYNDLRKLLPSNILPAHDGMSFYL